jgi:oxygen-independent coproporphyrinogen-3 oxidase
VYNDVYEMTSLALYIHWPFCLSKCPYCDFNSHVRAGVDQARWRNALLTELDTMAAKLPDRRLSSIFFGGGTPSLMPAETVAALIERATHHWQPSGNVEITLEANPTTIETATFGHFQQAGINRVSLGVQSFDDKELQFLGRGHSAREAMQAIESAQRHFSRVSFDLIYARPNQTLESWRAELSRALSFGTEHLSLYQLTIEPNTAFATAYAKREFALPEDDISAALYALTSEMTEASGLTPYEVSNYARPGAESRHNLTYWRGGDYAGIGPGAHGRIVVNAPAIAPTGAHMAHGSGLARPADRAISRVATATLKSPERWLAQVEAHGHAFEQWEALDARTDLEERLMMGLRLVSGIEDDVFMDILDAKKRALLTKEGLLADEPGKLKATRRGMLVLTSLTAALIA